MNKENFVILLRIQIGNLATFQNPVGTNVIILEIFLPKKWGKWAALPQITAIRAKFTQTSKKD
jgi:hypothetical protein